MRVIVSAVLGFTAAAVLAAAPSWADNLVVSVDHSVRLTMDGQASSVVVGNPQVADVAVIDTHTVFVSGRSVGLTDLVVLDPLGRTIFARDISVTRPGVGVVSVYRGAEMSELACSPSCSPYGGKTSGAPGAGGSSPPPGTTTAITLSQTSPK